MSLNAVLGIYIFDFLVDFPLPRCKGGALDDPIGNCRHCLVSIREVSGDFSSPLVTRLPDSVNGYNNMIALPTPVPVCSNQPLFCHSCFRVFVFFPSSFFITTFHTPTTP